MFRKLWKGIYGFNLQDVNDKDTAMVDYTLFSIVKSKNNNLETTRELQARSERPSSVELNKTIKKGHITNVSFTESVVDHSDTLYRYIVLLLKGIWYGQDMYTLKIKSV